MSICTSEDFESIDILISNLTQPLYLSSVFRQTVSDLDALFSELEIESEPHVYREKGDHTPLPCVSK